MSLFKSSPADKMKKAWTRGWTSHPYRELTDAEIERMMGKPKNIIDIDYQIDDGNDIYFEFEPIEPSALNGNTASTRFGINIPGVTIEKF